MLLGHLDMRRIVVIYYRVAVDIQKWHIQGDAVKEAYSGKYDMMIAHPTLYLYE